MNSSNSICILYDNATGVYKLELGENGREMPCSDTEELIKRIKSEGLNISSQEINRKAMFSYITGKPQYAFESEEQLDKLRVKINNREPFDRYKLELNCHLFELGDTFQFDVYRLKQSGKTYYQYCIDSLKLLNSLARITGHFLPQKEHLEPFQHLVANCLNGYQVEFESDLSFVSYEPSFPLHENSQIFKSCYLEAQLKHGGLEVEYGDRKELIWSLVDRKHRNYETVMKRIISGWPPQYAVELPTYNWRMISTKSVLKVPNTENGVKCKQKRQKWKMSEPYDSLYMKSYKLVDKDLLPLLQEKVEYTFEQKFLEV